MHTFTIDISHLLPPIFDCEEVKEHRRRLNILDSMFDDIDKADPVDVINAYDDIQTEQV